MQLSNASSNTYSQGKQVHAKSNIASKITTISPDRKRIRNVDAPSGKQDSNKVTGQSQSETMDRRLQSNFINSLSLSLYFALPIPHPLPPPLSLSLSLSLSLILFPSLDVGTARTAPEQSYDILAKSCRAKPASSTLSGVGPTIHWEG